MGNKKRKDRNKGRKGSHLNYKGSRKAAKFLSYTITFTNIVHFTFSSLLTLFFLSHCTKTYTIPCKIKQQKPFRDDLETAADNVIGAGGGEGDEMPYLEQACQIGLRGMC